MRAKAVHLSRYFIVFYPDEASRYADRYKLIRYPKIRVYPSTAKLLGNREYPIEELIKVVQDAALNSNIHQRKHLYKEDLEKLNDFLKKLKTDKLTKPNKRSNISQLTYPIIMFYKENRFYETLESHSTSLAKISTTSGETRKITNLIREFSSDSGRFFGLSDPLNNIAVAIFKRSVYTMTFFPHYLIGTSLSPYKRAKSLKINCLKLPHHLSESMDLCEFEAIRDHPYSLTFILLDLLQSLEPVNEILREAVKKEATKICLKIFLWEKLNKGEQNYLLRRIRESYQNYFPSNELVKVYAVMKTSSNFNQNRKNIIV